jgi:ribonuclease-3 family protein
MEFCGMMITNKKPSQLSPLALAYIGDGVYELFVRTRVIEEHENMPAHKLHKKTVQYVKAHAQANSIEALLSHLTEDETAVYKRGRNTKSYTTPKNADMADYRKATGFEALIGFLYLSGENERLNELMKIAYENALDNI